MREQGRESEWIKSFQRSLWLKIGCIKDLLLSLFLFSVVVDVDTEFASKAVLSELLYADHLVLMSETIEELRNEFIKWKETFKCKGLKVNLGKTKVLVSGRITKDSMSKSKIDPCGVCSLKVKAKSVLCIQCGKWIHGRCAGVIISNSKVFKKICMQKM